MLIIWLLFAALGVAAIVWGAETFAEHLAVASTRLGVSMFALAVLLAGGWLASDESSYITGTEQVIDAGLTAQ